LDPNGSFGAAAAFFGVTLALGATAFFVFGDSLAFGRTPRAGRCTPVDGPAGALGSLGAFFLGLGGMRYPKWRNSWTYTINCNAVQNDLERTGQELNQAAIRNAGGAPASKSTASIIAEAIPPVVAIMPHSTTIVGFLASSSRMSVNSVSIRSSRRSAAVRFSNLSSECMVRSFSGHLNQKHIRADNPLAGTLVRIPSVSTSLAWLIRSGYVAVRGPSL
jgi:hypothetical protein